MLFWYRYVLFLVAYYYSIYTPSRRYIRHCPKKVHRKDFDSPIMQIFRHAVVDSVRQLALPHKYNFPPANNPELRVTRGDIYNK